uniref:Uncharacterized protein LOC111099477 n=1 Tax=Crassostrea virginica TaxID=6565 RepID=A0A8B8A9C3_CRAVI|nr:uncharacterized protein LOC111099477 [Crassostrea virginica]
MSYKRREYDEDLVFSGQAIRPYLAYDNYLMYNNSVVSGHSIRDKFSAIGSHHSLYRLKGSDSGSFGSGSSRSGGCRRCIIISAVLLSLGVLGAVIGVAVFFSDQSPTMKTTTAVPPTTTTPSVPATFSGSLKLQQAFTQGLTNPSSTEYLDLASSVQQELDNTFRNSAMNNIYNYSKVIGFVSGSVVVKFRSYFIHNTVVVNNNGNEQQTRIDMAAVTKVIVDEIKAKKASGSSGYLSQADENSLLLSEGTDLPTTTVAAASTTRATSTQPPMTTQTNAATEATSTAAPTSTEPLTTTQSPTTQTDEATQSTTTTTAAATTTITTTAAQVSSAAPAPTEVTSQDPTTEGSETMTEQQTTTAATTTESTSQTTTEQAVSETQPSKKATTPMTTIPVTTSTTSIVTTTTTVPLPTTTEEPPPPVFVGEVKLNQTWDDSLNNTNSTEYQALAYDIEAELDATFKNSSLGDNYNYSKVTGFKPGSIEVDYISYFIETTLTVVDENGNKARMEMNASVVVEVFREEVKKKQEDQSHDGPKKSIFSAIIKESIKVVQLPPPQKPTQPTTYAPTEPPFTKPPMHPCSNFTLMRERGTACVLPLAAKFMGANDLMEFCQATKNLTQCVNENLYKSLNTSCSKDQEEALLRVFGPELQGTFNLPYNPSQCIGMTTLPPPTTTISPAPAYHCDNVTYIEIIGERCLFPLTARFQNATDLKEFCSVTMEMTECVNNNAYNENGAECSEVQIERLLQHFGPTLQRDLSLRYNPAQCLETGNKTTEQPRPTTTSPDPAYHCDNVTYIGSIGERCFVPLTVRFQNASDLKEFCSVTKEMTECVNRNAYNEKGAECSEVQIERLLQHFGPTLQRDLALRYNPAQCVGMENKTTDGDLTFSLKFLDMEWNMNLLNKTSTEYDLMKRTIMGNVTMQFVNISGISDMKIMAFRKGSLIVDFWFSITWPLRSGDLIENIKGILEKNGSIHMLPVDPQYFPHDTVMKEGMCPAVDQQTLGECNRTECEGDSHCKGNQKCCSNGCVKTCMDWEMYSTCQNVTYIHERARTNCSGAYFAFVNNLYSDDCSTYRDLIGCMTVNLQVSNHRCSMEGIATLVGKNMFKIFDGKKSTFNGLGCFDGVTNASNVDLSTLCRSSELYSYHLKYSCVVNTTESLHSEEEICSLYRYKLSCAEFSNRNYLKFGNCNSNFTKYIIRNNRSTLMPELDSRINDTVCSGQSTCKTLFYNELEILPSCFSMPLGIIGRIPRTACLALETMHDCLVAKTLQKNEYCSVADVSESVRLFVNYWTQSFFHSMNTPRLPRENITACTPTKERSDPGLNSNSTCHNPNMLVLLGTTCFEYFKNFSVSNYCQILQHLVIPCIQGIVSEFFHETCSTEQIQQTLGHRNDSIAQIVDRSAFTCPNISSTKSACMSFSTLLSPEYQRCFEAHYIFMYINMTSHDEKCRMYAHSVRCLEESLPNCKRGEVVPFLDFFLEYARLNGTERDYQCGVPQPIEAFCEDHEAVFLQIYGRCYHFLLYFHQGCLMTNYLLDCAYNATQESYFKCPESEVKQILINSTALLERKFPGHGENISSCLSLNTNYNACKDVEHIEKLGGECLRVYSINLTTAAESSAFCRAMHDFTKCTMSLLTNETGVRCSSEQVSGVVKLLGPQLKAELGLRFNPEECSFNTSESKTVKQAAFTIRLKSLNWTEELSDRRSAMFLLWNLSIVTNFSAAFGHYPGYMGVTVTQFRRGSVYADLDFRYDSSLISLTDAIEAARNATRSGNIYKLPVDDYFVFRGESKEGMCSVPARNSSATCVETCQMDSNCTGTQKCCFNGCGHTCQEAVYIKTDACEDLEHIEKLGGECLGVHSANLTNATESQAFCRAMHNFTKCVMDTLTRKTGVRCSSEQVMRVVKLLGPRLKAELGLRFNPEECFFNTSESKTVKQAAFTIRLKSLNWTEELSDRRSAMFLLWNLSIVTNFSAAFGHYPGYMGVTVTQFRRGSVYADLDFRYDSSLISLTDAIEAARNATRSGNIYKLPVDDYFVFRGESKEGMCSVPARNSSATCVETCQMDSNCTGTQKCCFNGCGHTCQEAVYIKTDACEDLEHIEKLGGECLGVHSANLTNATESQAFCRAMHNFTKCVMDTLTRKTGVRCSSEQVMRVVKLLGPRLKAELGLRFNPEECSFNTSESKTVKQAAFTIRLKSLNWTEELSDRRSAMFLLWNLSIVTNFSAAFGHYPGYMGVTVTQFRRGSVYADLDFRYDSSLISLTDAIEAARNATRSGNIYKLPVDDYFVFRGESKEGMCSVPARNSSATCVETCQMDSNCTGTQKCCFNGCGHTCQEAVYIKTDACEDLEHIEKLGGECLGVHSANLTNATESQAFCRAMHNFTKCVMDTLTRKTGVRCSSEQVMRVVKLLGPRLKAELGLRFNPEECSFNTSESKTVKQAAFTIRLKSLNWTEELSDRRSAMFLLWNLSIVTNFSAAFGHYPGYMGVTVTQFRRGSVYADLDFRYDSSLISLTDAIEAARNATRSGNIYKLPVDDYFVFRGESKEGMCSVPARNSSATCVETCQMDSNCTGTQKCCFNGCGHTCQEAVYIKTDACEDLEHIEKLGGECLGVHSANLTNATESQAFCRAMHNFTKCVMDTLTRKTGVRCSSEQVMRVVKLLGPRLKAELGLRFNPEECSFNTSESKTVKQAAFTIRLKSLNWTEELSDRRSAMFLLWNLSIVTNFSAAFGHYPGYMGVTVTQFRIGSVYADLDFRYDSSLISLTDAIEAARNATRSGNIYKLPVDDYFVFRGESKEGMCSVPARNSSATCVETCQMDSNCTGTQKCCFNGCGHTCQEAVYIKTDACEDLEHIEKLGGECLGVHSANLTNATESQAFCRAMHNFTKCVMDTLTRKTGVRCSSEQVMRVVKLLGPRLKAELGLRFNPEECSFNTSESKTVKQAAFTIRLKSLNWTEELSDRRSAMFLLWNLSIVTNFSAAFGHYPGYMGVTVTQFRIGSVYADLDFRYDSSLISLTDAIEAARNATRSGNIYKLPVDDYFVFRGESKEGMCSVPARNSSATCVETCQMDSNCTGTQKCCFNGCGHTCQEAVYIKTDACEDLEHIEKLGGECLGVHSANLTNATESQAFCRAMHNFTKCVMDTLTRKTGVRCSSEQVMRVVKLLGPRLKAELGLRFNPEECSFNTSESKTVKQAAFTIRLKSLNWTEELSDRRSAMFLLWNLSIVTNFSAAFGHYPGYMGVTVTQFRRGSVYADLDFRYDSSLISLTDAIEAARNATRSGNIYKLPVDDYFVFRGESKEGMCSVPARNSSATCVETCQMDSNCTGTQKCCFNGCGHTCQEAVYIKTDACEDLEHIEKLGGECLGVHSANLTNATESQAFCRAMHNFTKCVMDTLTRETGVRCSSEQVLSTVQILGPRLKADLNLQFNPEDCFKDAEKSAEMTTPRQK